MRLLCVLVCLVSLLAISSKVCAGVVFLKNGDRITGTVIRKTAENLIVQTAYAGELTIAWSQVQGFTTDKPVRLYLEGSGYTTGLVRRTDSGGQILVEDDDDPGALFELDSLAFVNPRKYETGEGLTWSGNVNFGFARERGNTDKDDYKLDGELNARGKDERFRLWANYDRERSSNRTTKSQWKTIGSYNRDITGKWYVFTNLFAEGDTKKDLTLRGTGSAGPGYRVFDSEELNLSLEAGPGVTVERWDSDQQQDDEYPAARWGVEYDQYVYQRLAQLFHQQHGVWNLKTTSDYAITTRTGVKFELTKNIQSTLSYRYVFDNAAPADRDKSDKGVLATIGYKW